MDTISTVGTRIRTLREQANMHQADLAAQLGISRPHLSKIERGRDLPGRETLIAVANTFGVSLDWLAEGHGDPRPAKAMDENEALLLFAWRQLTPEASRHFLAFLLSQIKKSDA